MTRSKIEWCDHTLNFITGCRHGCPYCYAEKMCKRFGGDVRYNKSLTDQYRMDGDLYILDDVFVHPETGQKIIAPFGFEPTLHKYRVRKLRELKSTHKIFVCAMSDMFGEWVPDEWIQLIFEECRKYPKHMYLFLTKNPKRYIELYKKGILPEEDNFWYGSTLTNPDGKYFESSRHKNFLSIEPLHEPFGTAHLTSLNYIDWVIIGAETGRRKERIVPKKEWVDEIVKECQLRKIPVFMKDSLVDIVGEENMIRQFPERLEAKEESDKVLRRTTSECLACKERKKNAEMVNITIRIKRHGKNKSFGYICKDCFRHFCREHDVEIPDLEDLRE